MRKHGILAITILAVTAFGVRPTVECRGADAYSSGSASSSSGNSFTDSVKKGFSSLTKPFSSSKAPDSTEDGSSLNNKSKPSVELYCSVASLYEQGGKLGEAEAQYQMALKEKPTHLKAMLGYARLMETQQRYPEAEALYQKALKAHPGDASIYNSIGLGMARRKKYKEASDALAQAVRLEPKNPLYTNNLATVLVDQNRLAEAFTVMRDVHGEAAAYYNIGYLLQKKGRMDVAEHHFMQALRSDPTMGEAKAWLDRLQKKQYDPPTSTEETFAAFKAQSRQQGVQPYYSRDAVAPQMAQQPMQPPRQDYRENNPYASNGVNPLPKPVYETARNPIPSYPNYDSSPETAPVVPTPQRLPPVTIQQPTAPMTNGSGDNFGDVTPNAPMPP